MPHVVKVELRETNRCPSTPLPMWFDSRMVRRRLIPAALSIVVALLGVIVVPRTAGASATRPNRHTTQMTVPITTQPPGTVAGKETKVGRLLRLVDPRGRSPVTLDIRVNPPRFMPITHPRTAPSGVKYVARIGVSIDVVRGTERLSTSDFYVLAETGNAVRGRFPTPSVHPASTLTAALRKFTTHALKAGERAAGTLRIDVPSTTGWVVFAGIGGWAY